MHSNNKSLSTTSAVPEKATPVYIMYIIITGNGIVTATLLGMLIIGCYNVEALNCSLTHAPMISDIGYYTPYDRFFTYALTLQGWLVGGITLAAYYAKFSTWQSEFWNKAFYNVSMVFMHLPPLIALFDEKLAPTLHSTIAVVFFIGCAFMSAYGVVMFNLN